MSLLSSLSSNICHWSQAPQELLAHHFERLLDNLLDHMTTIHMSLLHISTYNNHGSSLEPPEPVTHHLQTLQYNLLNHNPAIFPALSHISTNDIPCWSLEPQEPHIWLSVTLQANLLNYKTTIYKGLLHISIHNIHREPQKTFTHCLEIWQDIMLNHRTTTYILHRFVAYFNPQHLCLILETTSARC